MRGTYTDTSDVRIAEFCDTVSRISLRLNPVLTTVTCRVHLVLWLIPGGAA
jgi:hypothetical protein